MVVPSKSPLIPAFFQPLRIISRPWEALVKRVDIDEPLCMKWFNDAHFEVDINFLRIFTTLQLLLYCCKIVLDKFLSSKFLCCAIDSQIQWLKEMCHVGLATSSMDKDVSLLFTVSVI